MFGDASLPSPRLRAARSTEARQSLLANRRTAEKMANEAGGAGLACGGDWPHGDGAAGLCGEECQAVVGIGKVAEGEARRRQPDRESVGPGRSTAKADGVPAGRRLRWVSHPLLMTSASIIVRGRTELPRRQVPGGSMTWIACCRPDGKMAGECRIRLEVR
jgi:hypothetical protein